MEKKRGMARGAPLILISFFFFLPLHTFIVSSFPTILFPYPCISSAIIPLPCLFLSSFHPYFLPSSSYQPPTLFPPSVLCSSSFFACGMARDALPVIPSLHHLSPSRAGESARQREREEEKQKIGRGSERSRGEKRGAGARQKEKITLLPGLMNMGEG